MLTGAGATQASSWAWVGAAATAASLHTSGWPARAVAGARITAASAAPVIRVVLSMQVLLSDHHGAARANVRREVSA
ncbi:MAG: hypothetical protein IPL61_16580 [Myxococcales bacterium]|nr:hypothetical protein [Myxococcales bacterium]